ncbi:YDG domain-containing protein [Polaromonas sp. YR568]|uniref:YDG domain-containing protein n=1 Tax=Polaromonas sp. YR568 TaxID=1855301 RepID=UPI00398BE4ED
MKSHASLNRIYRLVWNTALNLWVAVAENAKGQGKSGSARNKAALLMLVPLAGLMQQARAADAANATVSAGTAGVATVGNTTTINQSSQRAAIDWTSLSTRANEALIFNQPNAQAIALNRITGTSASELLGSLTANGQVFILNPNGVLFGAGSQVNVGGLVASTLSMSNADFMAGNNVFTGSGGSGSVVNQGTLNAGQGGYLALLAPEVRNEGVMTASLGTALLAAGNKVTLNLDNGSLLGYSIDQGAINALAENKQLIKADGGQVLLSAKAMNSLTTATVNNTGVIEARTLQNKAGRILLMGDMETGTVNVGGTLDASAPTTGNGGFVETSAANVKVAAGTRVTTKAANGNSGTWLIDPVDFTIAAGSAAQDVSGMGADTLSANLNSGNVSIATSATTAGNGDIFVNSALSWSSANTLTLSAHRDIQINSAVTATAGGLTLNAGNVIGAPAAVNVGTFTLAGGTWSQLGGNLPVFSATDFRINGGTFIRAAGGDGASTATAYRLTDVYGLQGAGSAGMLGKHYALANNVDASGTSAWNTNAGFNPIGDGTSNFTGTFDGLGHTITGLAIDRAATSNTGLFGATEAGASISNVGLVGGSVKGKSNVGALVGRNQGGISDSYASTNVTGSATGDSVGGLVGLNGDGDIGGPAGAGNGGTISNSHASGIVAGRDYVGGLIGQSNSGAVTNSYATGRVTGRNYSGGLIGYNSNGIRSGGSDVSNSYATGNVTGNYSVGGLMGASEVGTITNSYATGTVVGSDQNVGGLIGSLQNADPSRGIVSNSYSTGNVTGLLLVGGLVGVNFGTIRNSYSTGRVSGGSNTGGLVGSSPQGSVTNSFWNKETSGQTSSAGSASSAGKTSAEMMMASTFTGAGWSASNVGGDGTTWRIYEGHTGPLLRSFLTARTLADTVLTYDGTTQVITAANVLGSASGRNAGTHSVSGFYSAQDGYDLSGGSLTINKASLILAAVTDSKTYDGSTASTMAVGMVGLFGGDNVTAAQSFGSKNVLGANGSTLAVDAGYTVADGNGGGNYNVTVTAAAGTINKATLSVTGVVADNKTYNGTDAATLSNIGTLNGLVGGETLALSQTAASFDNKNAGAGKVVTASGYGIADGSGGTAGLASNYQLASTTATASANIDKAALTVTATTVTRAYDGSTAATGAGTVGTLAGAGAGERVNAAGSQAYTDKNAGTGKTVTASGVTIKDAANLDVTGNYDITYVADNGSVINKATLSVTGVVADNRTYNGTDGATLSNIGTLSGLAAGETLALSQTAAAFGDKNAGTGKTVTATGYAIADGSGGTAGLASNYQLASTSATTTANIARANLSITTTDATKTYDGSTVATGTVVTTGTVYSGDSVSGGSFAFANKNAGTGDKVVNVSGATVGDGMNNANYNITYVANTTSTITKADLTVQASGVDKVYDGATAATVTLSGNGFVGDVLNLSANASFADKNAGAGKTVSVSGIAVTGADAGNYNLVSGTSASTTASITPRALTVTAADDAKNYDSVAYSGGNGVSYSGFVAGDSSADIGGTLAYGGSSQGAIAAGNYLITPGGLRSVSGNYTLGFNSGALSIAALNASSASLGGTALVGAYDGAMQAVAGLGGSSGGGGGGFGGSADAMAGALAAAAAEAGNTDEE